MAMRSMTAILWVYLLQFLVLANSTDDEHTRGDGEYIEPTGRTTYTMNVRIIEAEKFYAWISFRVALYLLLRRTYDSC